MDSISLEKATSTTAAAAAPSRNALIDTVDVRLETLLGHATLTVAELNALTPGSVIPLSASLSDLVEVRLNGIVVGHGELVAAGDQFAVRLTSLAP